MATSRARSAGRLRHGHYRENGDVAPYHDRQMAVLRRRQRMDWLDLSRPEHELLRPLPVGAFRIERAITPQAQKVLAL
jgi:putative SOS response-associated peptidase YedK